MFVREKTWRLLFLLVGFLSGGLGILYGMTFHYILLSMVLFYAILDWDSCVERLHAGRKYILVFIGYFLYLVLQTFFLFWDSGIEGNAHYGIFETTLLNFILVPVYVAMLKGWLTVPLLKRFLFLFCAGCVLLNGYIVFDLLAGEAFSNAQEALGRLYINRFGENKTSLLGGNLLLEPQVFYIVLAALVSYGLIFWSGRKRVKLACGIMFLLLLLFLSFTVSKAGILAFSLGFIVLNICFMKQNAWKFCWVFSVCVLCIGFMLFASDSFEQKYKERVDEVLTEVMNVRQGIYDGSTIAPRIGFIREAYRHANEFAVCGLGVYAKERVKIWLRDSDAGLGEFRNVHNTFLHYWIQGGILGISLVVFLWGVPLYCMVKNRKYSYLIISLVVVVVITNSTCILLDLNNSRLIIVLLSSMFYFHGDVFYELEKS